MNVLDEQLREDQRAKLGQWRIPFRQIGVELAAKGMSDADIVPFLQTLKRPVLFSHDQGFFKRRLAHPAYCLVWLDVSDIEAAIYIRAFLRHPLFHTHAKRMGMVARVHYDGIACFERNRPKLWRTDWKR